MSVRLQSIEQQQIEQVKLVYPCYWNNAFSKGNEGTGGALGKPDSCLFSLPNRSCLRGLIKHILCYMIWCHYHHFDSIGLNNGHLLFQLMLIWNGKNIKNLLKAGLKNWDRTENKLIWPPFIFIQSCNKDLTRLEKAHL